MLSRVDLPQPEGPMRTTKSPSCTSKSTRSRTTCSRPSRARKTRVTPSQRRIGSLGMNRELAVPAEERALDDDDRAVGEEPEHAEHDHRGDDDVVAVERVGVEERVTDAGLHREQLGDDDENPREPH